LSSPALPQCTANVSVGSLASKAAEAVRPHPVKSLTSTCPAPRAHPSTASDLCNPLDLSALPAQGPVGALLALRVPDTRAGSNRTHGLPCSGTRIAHQSSRSDQIIGTHGRFAVQLAFRVYTARDGHTPGRINQSAVDNLAGDLSAALASSGLGNKDDIPRAIERICAGRGTDASKSYNDHGKRECEFCLQGLYA
jgi:hypothetical protein